MVREARGGPRTRAKGFSLQDVPVITSQVKMGDTASHGYVMKLKKKPQ